MSLRDALRKAASLLVELPAEQAGSSQKEAKNPELEQLMAEISAETPKPPDSAPPAPAKTVEQIVREAPGPNLEEIDVPAAASLTGTDGKVDFVALYRMAGLPPASFTAEQTLDMLASMPSELPLETKRQTVKVTLGAMGKALGATPDTIVADASRKLAALAAYVENLSKQTAEFVSVSQSEIAALQAQIERKRASVEETQRKLVQATQACTAESDRLHNVLEFFSLDAPSPPPGASQNTASNPAPTQSTHKEG